MEKQICPECGAPISQSEQSQTCPECGCPLSQQAISAAIADSEIKAEAPETAKHDGDKNEMNAEAAKSGFYDVWRKNSKSEYRTSCAISAISVILLLAAIGLGLGFIIHTIVRGTQVNDDISMYFEFRTKTIKFTATVGALLVAALIFDIIGDCYEIAKCSYWLRANCIDASKSLEVTAYRTASKKKQSDGMHEIKIAYCATYSKKTDRFIIAHILECIIIAVFYITAGIIVAIAINGFIAYTADLRGIAFPIGFAIGTCVAAGLPGVLRSIINHYAFAPAKIWAFSQTAK